MLYYKMVRNVPVESVVWIPMPAVQYPFDSSFEFFNSVDEAEADFPGWRCAGYDFKEFDEGIGKFLDTPE